MERIYIVGGGSSLRGFDWRRLDGRRVIAVNRAFEVLPNAECVYFSDLRFWTWHSEKLLQHKARKISGVRRMPHEAIETYQITGITGLDMNPGCLRQGNNSGYGAINLAAHLKVKEIMLLGFDMQFTAGQCHWHDGYPVINVERVFGKMVGFFDSLVQPLKDLGISVFNANPSSVLSTFPKISLDEALE